MCVCVCRWVCVCWHTLNPEMCFSLSRLTELRPVEVLFCQTARHGKSTESRSEQGEAAATYNHLNTHRQHITRVLRKSENSPGTFTFSHFILKVLTRTSDMSYFIDTFTVLLASLILRYHIGSPAVWICVLETLQCSATVFTAYFAHDMSTRRGLT